MADMRIKFLVPYVVKDHRTKTPQAESYAEGEEVTLPEASAQHFIGRQVAVLVGAPAGTSAVTAGPTPAEDHVPTPGQTMRELPPERQPLQQPTIEPQADTAKGKPKR